MEPLSFYYYTNRLMTCQEKSLKKQQLSQLLFVLRRYLLRQESRSFYGHNM